MTNNSKQIYDLLMASKRLTPTFAQALHKHPNAKRFSIIATKSEHVFTLSQPILSVLRQVTLS